jgi:hypothetical protein
MLEHTKGHLPMTTDWKARSAAIEADPAVREAEATHTALRDQAQELRFKPLQLARKISAFQLGSDMLMRKGWDLEDVPKEQDDQLERFTGHDAECWWHQYNAAETALDELIIQTCRAVVQAQDLLDAAEAKREAAWNVLSKARQDAAKRYDAAQSAD